MKTKRIISAFLTIVTALSLSCIVYADGAVTTLAELQAAFTAGGSYTLESDFNVTNSGITKDVTIDGGTHTLTSTQTGDGSTIFQNENVNSTLKNITIIGNAKSDVGIWEGAGSMTLENVTVKNYTVTSGYRMAAISAGSSGSGKQGNLTLNNVTLENNSTYDITLADQATVTINEGTTLKKLRLQSNTGKLNIGANWTGSFEITMDTPASVELGTVGAGADVSGITVSGNGGYEVKNNNGKLVITNDNGAVIRFDMNNRGLLYKGSTGFLYGVAEPNVPTIDLLQGLQPAVMVQKAMGGLQHPTGDATRVRSALGAAGVKSIQVYFQDIYLEWPYDAPMSNGQIDVNAYTKTCEEILYKMICDKANEGDNGAFLGSDGNYYVLNKEEAAKYSYVLFNEPDQIWYGKNLSGLEAAWKQVYEAVQKIDPNAKCAGPNYSSFNSSDYNNFLSYCKTNNCLPEIISWHELLDNAMGNFPNNYNTVKGYISKYYADAGFEPELLVNEYARHYDIATTGGLVRWLSMFEDRDMDGCMAYWGMANSLNEVAADQNSPGSTWWVYHWYAQMSGEQTAITGTSLANDKLYGVASYDDDIPMAYVLFGGEANENKETVYLDNMDTTKLIGTNSAVRVKVYGVGFSGQHGANYKPEVVFDGAVNVTDNTLKIQVMDTEEMDAYFAVITPTNETGEAMQNAKISTISYEAENAQLLGGAKAYTKTGWSTWAASGRKDVGSINNNGDGVKFTVTVPENGTYDLGLFYSLQAPFVNPQTLKPDANGQNRGIGKVLPFGMQVDNGSVETIYLDSTITWNYRRPCHVDAELTAGEHTITFTQINGDEGSKGNLQLAATVDKIDLDLIKDEDTRYDFEIDLTEMKSFKDGDRYEVTAVAPAAGYYTVTGDDDNFTLTRQSVDYASDAKSYSEVSTYDVEVSKTVYLSQGANTIGVSGDAKILTFAYDAEKTKAASTTIGAEDIAIHGTNAYYKEQEYASSKAVITELGIGQNANKGDKGEDNYIELNVNVKSAGVYNIAISYANDEPAPVMLKSNGATYVHSYNIDLVERYAQIKVNDNDPETVYFRHTMSWETFKTVDMQASFKAGDNTIKIYNDNSYQFSSLVNSTAPEIDAITITKQSYEDNETITISSEAGTLDTSALDEAIAEANAILEDTDTVYSDETIAALQTAVDSVNRATQSDVNQSRKNILDAINGLKPKTLNLADYYVTSYASSDKGTPGNSFDGNSSTAWTATRSASPYVAYEVFDAGEGKVFDLTEMYLQGDSNTKVVYLGTNSDNILKTPAEMGSSGDLCKKDNELYVPFANLYDAKILGTASGASASTPLSGQYRYIVVALATWEKTSVNELGLSARVVELPKTHITITSDADTMYADYTIVDETGTLYAYFAKYDGNRLVEVKTSAVTKKSLRLAIPITDGKYTYKAFLWNEEQKPSIPNFVAWYIEFAGNAT